MDGAGSGAGDGSLPGALLPRDKARLLMARTFRTPAPWGIGPGPAKLYTVDGTLAAVDAWLELTPDRMATRKERELMLTLRDVLAYIPAEPSAADLYSAKRAIKGMVKYAKGAEAQGARVSSFMEPSQAAPEPTPHMHWHRAADRASSTGNTGR
ncbi:hypothetical protein [Vineibacter terrae]|uniref:hypothetical protein n=1 Tax=Vineibacter terrae TaxID=2586908 RepID=UPI002E33BD79|nr:hypothetical protein [Vineibacter terrae]HEX2888318.1 hypothetical protein [Vineibacter terrae]